MREILSAGNFSAGHRVEAVRSPFIMPLFNNFLNTNLLRLLNEEPRIELILDVVKNSISDTRLPLSNPSL